jgi:hypothetical protein
VARAGKFIIEVPDYKPLATIFEIAGLN